MRTRRGFTLAELMICLAIVAVITSVALYAFRSFDKGIKYIYSNTYHNLDRAWYNAVEYWIPEDRENRDPFANNADMYQAGQRGDVNFSPAEVTTRFCNALTHYINTVNESCEQVNLNIENNNFGEPQFVAGNGVRFWVIGIFPERNMNDYGVAIGGEEGRPITHFFLILADMNGTRFPNSMRYERGNEDNEWRTTDPDIFAFAALETGRVIPLGPPEFDDRYMSARIVFPNTRRGDGERHLRYSPHSMPYAVAKAEAWGYYLVPPANNTPEVGDDNNTDFMTDTPYSYNEYVRRVLNGSSLGEQIYQFLGESTPQEYFNNIYQGRIGANPGQIHLMSNPQDAAVNPEFGCVSRSDVECDIIIDKYVH